MSAPDLAAARRRVRRVIDRLQAVFGRQVWKRWGDGLEELVGTILSQNTSNANSGPAYQKLAAAFAVRSRADSQAGRTGRAGPRRQPAHGRPDESTGRVDWDAMADAPVGAIERAIRSAGLSRQKSVRIWQILRRIRRERGELSLEFLADLSPQQARAYLTAFPGVGPKTAACVLLFSFHMPVLPVDTHIHRIGIRLGLLPPGTSADDAHAALERLVPPDEFYNFHILLIRHGRQICRARRPRCHDCVLLRMCPAGRRFIRTGAAAGSIRG